MKLDVWIVTPYNVVVGYRHFGVPCCLHLQIILKVDVARSSENSVSYRNTTRRHNPNEQDFNVSTFHDDTSFSDSFIHKFVIFLYGKADIFVCPHSWCTSVYSAILWDIL